VRLVLAAKKISYQDVQVNLEKRAKWHYLLNGGFVPMLETPDSGDSKPYMIFESKIIMDFLDRRFPDKLLYS
jgi:glutathione S-transferase